MKKRNKTEVRLYFTFTGAKNEINHIWSQTCFDDYFNIDIFPSKGDLLDFEYLMDPKGVENMIEDYNTTIFEVISRTFMPILDGAEHLRLTFTIKPSF